MTDSKNSSAPQAQFARIETGAQRNGHAKPKDRKKGTRERIWSVNQLLSEAERLPGHVPHIPNPDPNPQWIIGSADAVCLAAKAWHDQARQPNGGRWPCNSPSVACAVVSMYRDKEDMWSAYMDDIILHFRKVYGPRLKGAVQHLDESNPHIHVYLVPAPGEPFGVVHPGYAASRACRRTALNPEGTNRVGQAYMGAMKTWQDEVYSGTNAQAYGLARLGPVRRRLDRSEHNANKAAAELLKKAEAQAQTLIADAMKKVNAFVEAQNKVAAESRENNRTLVLLRAREERIELTDKGSLDTKVSELTDTVAQLTKKLGDALFRIEELKRALTPAQSVTGYEKPGGGWKVEMKPGE